jgi:NTE family protein
VGQKLYWDGGCVSNTPLDVVVNDPPPGHTVVFVIDLWSASGLPPDTMPTVEWRAKQIQYASRTATHLDAAATKLNLRHARRLQAEPETNRTHQRLDLVHVVYQPGADQIPSSDAEFSRSSIAERREAGLKDMRRALAAKPWRRAKPAHVSSLIHCVSTRGVTTMDPG